MAIVSCKPTSAGRRHVRRAGRLLPCAARRRIEDVSEGAGRGAGAQAGRTRRPARDSA